MKRLSTRLLATAALLTLAAPVHANFHVMQIEQVIAGVNGDQSVQAIQLRMRGAGQNFVNQATIRVFDAAGLNPVTLINMASNVANGAGGARILIASSNITTFGGPPPDFVLTTLIPPAYLAAGSMTFEHDGGTVYWRLSWGGAGYTGTGPGDLTNDADGNFNPPFGSPLPTSSTQAVQFTGLFSAPSTTNEADYALTAGAAVLTNNAGNSGTVSGSTGVGGDGITSVALSAPAPNPVTSTLAYTLSLPRATRVQVRVLDTNGRQRAMLLDRAIDGGRHSFSWRAAGSAGALESGIYYLSLKADGVETTRKFAVLR